MNQQQQTSMFNTTITTQPTALLINSAINDQPLQQATSIPDGGLALNSAEIIPRSVLAQTYQIETKLEFPTKYHVMQLTKNNKSLLKPPSSSPSTGGGIESPSRVKSASGHRLSAGKPRASLKHSSSIGKPIFKTSVSPNENNQDYDANFDRASSCQSFDSQSLISSPASSTFSQSDLFSGDLDDIVLDDIKQYIMQKRSSTSELGGQLEKYIVNSPKTMPNDMFYLNTPPGISARPSTSCPNDMARLKKLQSMNLTEEEIRYFLKEIKEKQKKESHNLVERRRRFNINDRINELGGILNRENKLTDKKNKGLILKASIEYIQNLENKLTHTKELEDKLSQMTMLNRQLMERINELEVTTSNQNVNEQQKNSQSQLCLDETQTGGFFNASSENFGAQIQNQSGFLSQLQPLVKTESDLLADEAKALEEMLSFYQDNNLITIEDQANVHLLIGGLGNEVNHMDAYN